MDRCFDLPSILAVVSTSIVVSYVPVATAHYRVGGGRPDAHGSRPQGGEAPRGFRECAAGCGGPNVLYYTPSSGEIWGMMSLGSVVVVVGWPARSLDTLVHSCTM